jgi:5-oxoprolinase (ATP-hydrolysing) subunit A
MRFIDLNSDMGEGFGPWNMGDDKAMLEIISTANIACGFHAGDAVIMHDTAKLALEKGVKIGAHPGFNDLYGFGRRVIKGESLSDIERQVSYQIGAMQALAHVAGHKVTHVKIHGALSNMAQEDEDLALALGRAIKAVDRNLIYVVLPLLPMEKAAQKLNMPYINEIFADRAYLENGNLVSRKIHGAVIHDAEKAAQNMLEMLEAGAIITLDGKRLKTKIETICVHSDTPQAVRIAKTVREKLINNGWEIRAF